MRMKGIPVGVCVEYFFHKVEVNSLDKFCPPSGARRVGCTFL